MRTGSSYTSVNPVENPVRTSTYVPNTSTYYQDSYVPSSPRYSYRAKDVVYQSPVRHSRVEGYVSNQPSRVYTSNAPTYSYVDGQRSTVVRDPVTRTYVSGTDNRSYVSNAPVTRSYVPGRSVVEVQSGRPNRFREKYSNLPVTTEKKKKVCGCC